MPVQQEFSLSFCSRSDYQSFSTKFLLIYEGTMELKAAKMPCQYGSPWCLMFQKGELSIWTHILELSWHQQWVTTESRTEAKLCCQETFLQEFVVFSTTLIAFSPSEFLKLCGFLMFFWHPTPKKFNRINSSAPLGPREVPCWPPRAAARGGSRCAVCFRGPCPWRRSLEATWRDGWRYRWSAPKSINVHTEFWHAKFCQ